MSNYINVFTGDYIIAQRIVASLEKAGIIPVVKDRTDSGLTQLFGSKSAPIQQVLVHKDEVDRVMPIVNKLTSELKA